MQAGFAAVLEPMLRHGVAAAFAGAPLAGDWTCAGRPWPDAQAPDLALMTISAADARLSLLLPFDGARASPEAMAERANLCCGALKRDLGHSWPQLGMSTPTMLRRDVLGAVGLLRMAGALHGRLSLPDGGVQHAILGWTCDADVPPLQPPPAAEEPAQACGELELF